MPRHLLVLKGLARILTLTGRTMTTMRDRYAVTGAQPAEIMPLHRAGKALADRDSDHVDMLPRKKMGGGDLRTDFQQGIPGDAKLGKTRLRLDLRLGEMAPLRLGHILCFCGSDAELQGCVTVLLLGANGDDLAVVDPEHGHRDMIPLCREDAGHAQFSREEAGAHPSFLRA